MSIEKLRDDWNRLGESDPFWAILSDPEKKGGKWDLDEFFKSGEEFVRFIMDKVKALKPDLAMKRALDFGCGAGRLTQPLSRYFESAVGVDIAESMIELANKYNRNPVKCRYIVNKKDNLAVFEGGSFELIMTFLVLQHMRPEYSKNYIKEFLRILAPGGMIVFQAPGELKAKFRPSKLDVTISIFKTAKGLIFEKPSSGDSKAGESAPAIEMHGLPKAELVKLIEENGGKIIKIEENEWAGKEWTSFIYFITK